MVSVGRAVGIYGHHFAHGDGKLDLPGAQRDRYSSCCIPRYGGKIKHVRCHSGGHIRLVAWGDGDLLGCIVAWRVFIARWGRYFLLSEHKLERAENWVRRYEAGGIFFARLLPVIRHVISIPAGIIRMNFTTFSVMTLAGSALWCSVLAWFGQKVLTREMIESKDATALIKAVKESGNFHTIVIACVVITVLYQLVVSLTGKKRSN